MNKALELKRKDIWYITEYAKLYISEQPDKFYPIDTPDYLFWIYYFANLTHMTSYAVDLLSRKIYEFADLTILDYKLEFLDGIKNAKDTTENPRNWLSPTDIEAIEHAVKLVTAFIIEQE